jgi:hypothetical protein
VKRARFVLTVGAEGEAVSFEKDRLQLASTSPVPPGSRVEGTVAGSVAIRGKVIGARRSPVPGVYEVTIKLADLTREERTRLTELCS